MWKNGEWKVIGRLTNTNISQISETNVPLQLLLSLFRIIEPTSGTIYIDGVDITKIGLHDCKLLRYLQPLLSAYIFRIKYVPPSQLCPNHQISLRALLEKMSTQLERIQTRISGLPSNMYVTPTTLWFYSLTPLTVASQTIHRVSFWRTRRAC